MVILKMVLVPVMMAELVLAVEVGLRFFAFPNIGRAYYLWPPYFSRVFTPLPDKFPGISGEKRFFINSLGMRGDELVSRSNKRFLALGGSTTEGGMLDEKETWPYVLQTKLQEEYGDPVWVGNAGRRGSTSRDHLWHMKYFVPQIEKVDTILLLTGANDFMLHLYDSYIPEFITPEAEANTDQLNHAFFIHPRVAQGIKGTALWQTAKRLKVAFLGRNKIFDSEGRTQIEWQKKRAQSPKIDQLPDLSAGLNEYSYNLRQIIKMGKDRKLRLIFMTQPSLWKSDLTHTEDNLLWFGCAENQIYTCYSAKVLDAGLELYNQVVRDVCQSEQLECIDLARQLPKDTTVFYDDVHFNTSGAQKVAQVIFSRLNESLK